MGSGPGPTLRPLKIHLRLLLPLGLLLTPLEFGTTVVNLALNLTRTSDVNLESQSILLLIGGKSINKHKKRIWSEKMSVVFSRTYYLTRNFQGILYR